ncbi:hypothetical protein C8R42DRAFT_718777 [Lentinula raphanica]|nr:hypothetical protein C8R42DRAFT_718777 [Lentinula raphanica]
MSLNYFLTRRSLSPELPPSLNFLTLFISSRTSSLCSLHTYHLLKLVLSGRRLTLDISSHPSRSLSPRTRRLLTRVVPSLSPSPHTCRLLTHPVSSHPHTTHIASSRLSASIPVHLIQCPKVLSLNGFRVSHICLLLTVATGASFGGLESYMKLVDKG